MIQVGQVLDKYELLERVGQGGMAVVYRGLDRSLKRVVAVKILHKHLADYQEARDRFEREAQAVAKLRHENILEIFDYAAKPESEAYIVTEFIDGQTLKQVITDRPIAFPELGAMLIIQVGRALAHAHAGGILHRDVKPENIMIRTDGVVKLMDFGISHMVDLERLTVTGQLLGSPAYMAPEHVEGRPLDFRTDVFAAGIVLYQLCVGKLPFEGKNPHEVLKRIAECRFIDPRTANPRIGNRLGRIILRAMAAAPADRFASVGEMVTALEGYLDESGLPHDKVKLASELARYFSSPVAYEQALEDRLIAHLTKRGQELLERDDRAAALDLFDRVLTIDADNAKVIAILDGLNRRARVKAAGLGVLAALVIGGGALMIHNKTRETSEALELAPTIASHDGRTVRVVAPEDQPPPPLVDDAQDLATAADASTGGTVATNGNGAATNGGTTTNNGGSRPPPPDAAPIASASWPVTVSVTPRMGSEVAFGDGEWVPLTPETGTLARTLDREIIVRARNECCEPQEAFAKAGVSQLVFNLQFRPAGVTVSCPTEVDGTPREVFVTVAGKAATLGANALVLFEGSIDQKTATIEFVTSSAVDPSLTKSWTQKIQVRAGKKYKVTCEPPP
ncbi:MAG TPA: serine/threonine-protein kinase [Kofleriaceae bacterium]|nr:serine/threonine-protein kinase [Kofleriaceae bacterium]